VSVCLCHSFRNFFQSVIYLLQQRRTRSSSCYFRSEQYDYNDAAFKMYTASLRQGCTWGAMGCYCYLNIYLSTWNCAGNILENNNQVGGNFGLIVFSTEDKEQTRNVGQEDMPMVMQHINLINYTIFVLPV